MVDASWSGIQKFRRHVGISSKSKTSIAFTRAWKKNDYIKGNFITDENNQQRLTHWLIGARQSKNYYVTLIRKFDGGQSIDWFIELNWFIDSLIHCQTKISDKNLVPFLKKILPLDDLESCWKNLVDNLPWLVPFGKLEPQPPTGQATLLHPCPVARRWCQNRIHAPWPSWWDKYDPPRPTGVEYYPVTLRPSIPRSAHERPRNVVPCDLANREESSQELALFPGGPGRISGSIGADFPLNQKSRT